jgi:hypothetical protein
VKSHPKQPKFLANLLDWPVNRADRTFQVYVVEPGHYEPKNHARIFDAAINVFIERRAARVDPYSRDASAAPPLHFDLVTFPEAFLPPERLLDILKNVGRLDDFGCVHVGLRPSATEPNHLFLASELKALRDELKAVPGLWTADLDSFSGWLDLQDDKLRFNVGCLFTVDAEQRVRVCLHPKLVQSKYEVSPLPEQNMEEANLLTVVTLRPTNKKLKTIIVQPLLCSDALHLATKRTDSRPLEALQSDAECLGANPPDHIDIVSVPTCTRQVPGPSSKASYYRTWHNEFKRTFERAASDDALARHHFATFVLSNFQMMPEGEPGGLSGAFIPIAVGHAAFPDYVTLSCWGHPKDTEGNRWSTPDEDCTRGKWSTLGYIASLNPFNGKPEAMARMFGFTVRQLPRDQSSWGSKYGLTDCTLRTGEDQGSPPSLIFATS